MHASWFLPAQPPRTWPGQLSRDSPRRVEAKAQHKPQARPVVEADGCDSVGSIHYPALRCP